jgi:hypothetical protein
MTSTCEEQARAVEEMLAGIGFPRGAADIYAFLCDAVEQDLRPTEVVPLLLGKRARLLAPEVAQPLVEKLFTLFDSIGREPLPAVREGLQQQVTQLRDALGEVRRGLMRPILSAQEEVVLDRVQEAEATLAALAQDLESIPMTRRFSVDAHRALDHVLSLARGSALVLAW